MTGLYLSGSQYTYSSVFMPEKVRLTAKVIQLKMETILCRINQRIFKSQNEKKKKKESYYRLIKEVNCTASTRAKSSSHTDTFNKMLGTRFRKK